MRKPPDMLLSVDPGETTGWAYFEYGKYTHSGQIKGLKDLTDMLELLEPPDIVVMEKYRLFKWLALQQSGSRMEVAQAEGVVSSYCLRNGIPLIEQSPQALAVGRMYSKVDERQGAHKMSHWKSAMNHGYYYLVKNNMRLPEGM